MNISLMKVPEMEELIQVDNQQKALNSRRNLKKICKTIKKEMVGKEHLNSKSINSRKDSHSMKEGGSQN